MKPKSVLGSSTAELRDALSAQGFEAYRAEQVLHWIFRRNVLDFSAMSNLRLEQRRQLAAEWCVHPLERAAVFGGEDGTQKLQLLTHDGASIETVLIPEDRRYTVCVSSQVGCSLDCSFCATGRLGLGRNLGADEIVDQVVHAQDVAHTMGNDVSHIVFMGMGEPLLNLKNVLQAIRVLIDPKAGGFSPKRITVSTAGVVPKMAELGQAVPVRLAVSLHATTDEVRNRLVPLNRRFPIATLLEACRRYPASDRERISFEYTMIRDVNDSAADAQRLIKLVRGLRAKVNLIPLNEHPGANFRRPHDAAVSRFADILAHGRVTVTVRRSRGDDIYAACGQLGAVAREAETPIEAETRR